MPYWQLGANFVLGTARLGTPLYLTSPRVIGPHGERQMWWDGDPSVIHMFLVTGQSLALGSNPDAGDPRDTAISTTSLHPGAALMFDAGVVPNGAEVNAFVDLVERDLQPACTVGPGTKETICSAFANTLIDIVQAKFSLTPTILMAAAATGGTPYRGMQRGWRAYTEALRLVDRAVAIAAESGRRIICHVIIVHGEADIKGLVGTEDYVRMLTQWRRHLDADIRPMTGQSDPVKALVNQCNRSSARAQSEPTTPIAALLATYADPHITCFGPIYDIDTDSTTSHPRSTGYLKFGTRAAYYAAQSFYDVGLQPLHVIDCYWQMPTNIRARYNRAVTIDDSGDIVARDGIESSRGFEFCDGSDYPPRVIDVVVTRAINTLAFAGTGAQGDTITIGAHVITLGSEVAVGADAVETAQAVKEYINAHPTETGVTADGSGAILYLTAIVSGPAGDLIASTSTPSSDAQFGGETFAGGADTIEIVLDRDPIGLNPRLYYAARAPRGGMGRLVGPRGLIRAPDALGTDRLGNPVYEWACHETLRPRR